MKFMEKKDMVKNYKRQFRGIQQNNRRKAKEEERLVKARINIQVSSRK